MLAVATIGRFLCFVYFFAYPVQSHDLRELLKRAECGGSVCQVKTSLNGFQSHENGTALAGTCPNVVSVYVEGG